MKKFHIIKWVIFFMMSSINIHDFLKLSENINIIDIRNKEKYNSNHIKNAINIPYNILLMSPEKYISKEKKYYIYCQKGLSSYNICRILSNLGYKVININGGYERYIMNKGNH